MAALARHVLVFLALLLSLCVAQEKPDKRPGLTTMDIFNLQTVSDPQISPDGKRIVYVRGFADVMQDKRCSNLWVINFDGSNHRPLTTGLRNDSSPRWSPDGTRIAYVSSSDGSPQIYVRWMDTGETARITSLQYAPSGLAWSPDGRQIAFTSFVPADAVKLGAVPRPPTGAKWAEAATIYDRTLYRFNGAGYLKPGYTQVFVVSADGGTPRQISSGNFQYGGPGNSASAPAWSPDGKYLLVSANRHDDWENNPADTEVYEFSVTDGSVRGLTDRRGPDGAPAISSDGKLIAYTGYDDRFQGHQLSRLYLMERSGSGSRLLSAKLDRDVGALRWAPDNSGVYFVYGDQGVGKIGFYGVDSSFRQVAENVALGGFSVASNGAMATIQTTPDRPGDLAVIAPGKNSQARLITDVNRDLLAQRRLGQVEEIWYTSSKDGRKIEGWIVKPPDFDPARKYPMILEIHGGPFSFYGPRFDLEKQIYAGAGYVVLYTNPRGSTSYGEEFGNLIHHAYPGDDFYDLNSGVDAMIAKGYVDPDNVFVAGGSGGGVLTCWMIGRSTRFRAAASLYPVTDWYSFALTADIPITVVKYWFPGMPWDYPEQYAKRSVISLVKNVKTPTLLMTGESDYRTPIAQAEEYYAALRLLGVESVLVRVPDEPHGLSQHPSHHVAKLSYVIGWFDRHRSTAEKATQKAAGN